MNSVRATTITKNAPSDDLCRERRVGPQALASGERAPACKPGEEGMGCRPDSPRAAPWRDMTRPALEELYKDQRRRDHPATRLQREIGFDTIMASLPL